MDVSVNVCLAAGMGVTPLDILEVKVYFSTERVPVKPTMASPPIMLPFNDHPNPIQPPLLLATSNLPQRIPLLLPGSDGSR